MIFEFAGVSQSGPRQDQVPGLVPILNGKKEPQGIAGLAVPPFLKLVFRLIAVDRDWG